MPFYFFKSSIRVLLLISFILTSYQAQADKVRDENTITGAGAHFAWVIFDSLKEELKKTTGRDIHLYGKNSNLGMGCNAGIKLAQQNQPGHETFGFVCCPLSQEEIDKKHIKVYPLADEPIYIVVHKNNPINNLSTEQVRSIFRGDITNWKEVGGWDKNIAVITRLHCKKRPGHWKTILPGAEHFVKKRLNVTSASEMERLVSSFETSFGHIGSTWVFADDSKVKVLTINNVKPTAENLKNKTYPFHRRLSAVTNLTPSADVLKVIHQVQNGKSFDAMARKYNLLSVDEK